MWHYNLSHSCPVFHRKTPPIFKYEGSRSRISNRTSCPKVNGRCVQGGGDKSNTRNGCSKAKSYQSHPRAILYKTYKLRRKGASLDCPVQVTPMVTPPRMKTNCKNYGSSGQLTFIGYIVSIRNVFYFFRATSVGLSGTPL